MLNKSVLTGGLTGLLLAVGCQAAPPSAAPPAGPVVAAPEIAFEVEVVATGLTIPWSLVFLPDGRLLFTERPGRVQVLDLSGGLPATPSPIAGAPTDVRHFGEGGLMGLTLHPRFGENGWVYLSYTYGVGDRAVRNRVVRYRLADDRLSDRRVIVDDLPGAGAHNGCRLRFGRDGKLYITTGDSATREIAQQMDNLGGKVLRVNDDGTLPADNPFPNSAIYSIGHRNPQGLDWHAPSGLLFTAEHGPSGFDGPGGGDEVNITEAGKNYGWPVIHHRETREGMESPLLEYTPAVAPGGLAFYTGDKFPAWRNNLFLCTLRGADLRRIVLDAENPRRVARDIPLFDGQYGRLRDVVTGPDGYLYFCTSNRDGRGPAHADDDRILRLVPRAD